MDPSYRRTRQEAAVAALLWLVAGVWTVGLSYWLGYRGDIRSVYGVPHWVVWGILAPWLVFFVANCWYSLFYLRDDRGASRGGPSHPDSGSE